MYTSTGEEVGVGTRLRTLRPVYSLIIIMTSLLQWDSQLPIPSWWKDGLWARWQEYMCARLHSVTDVSPGSFPAWGSLLPHSTSMVGVVTTILLSRVIVSRTESFIRKCHFQKSICSTCTTSIIMLYSFDLSGFWTHACRYVPLTPDPNSQNIVSEENTVIFQLANFQYLGLSIAMSVAAPFRKPIL